MHAKNGSGMDRGRVNPASHRLTHNMEAITPSHAALVLACEYSRRSFAPQLAALNMSLSPLPHEAFVTGLCFASSNQHRANRVTVAPWHTKSVRRKLVASKATLLENYLRVSACVLNRSSIECREKKRQKFQFIWCSIWNPGDSNF